MRFLVAAGLLSLMLVGHAVACQCLGLSIEEQIDRAAHVFRGRITSADWVRSGPEGTGRVNAKFEVIAVLKGDPTRLEGLSTATGPGDCGVPIIVGMEYVFFLGANGETSSCNGTMPRTRVNVGNAGEWYEFVTRYGLGTE
jgi:hypothetical protein